MIRTCICAYQWINEVVFLEIVRILTLNDFLLNCDDLPGKNNKNPQRSRLSETLILNKLFWLCSRRATVKLAFVIKEKDQSPLTQVPKETNIQSLIFLD